MERLTALGREEALMNAENSVCGGFHPLGESAARTMELRCHALTASLVPVGTSPQQSQRQN
jgi:hypothetical protein